MKIRKILNILMIIIILYEWSKMFYGEDGMLASRGISSLKFFTILSNLLAALASLLWLINQNEKLKYVATVCLTLTFITVMVFLGPLFGYRFMFSGPNLYFHLIIPLLAIFELIFFNKEILNSKDNLLAIIPMLLYGIFYVGNILINGLGNKMNTNDWYGFFSWGKPMGFVIFIIIIIATYLMGFILRLLSNHFI